MKTPLEQAQVDGNPEFKRFPLQRPEAPTVPAFAHLRDYPLVACVEETVSIKVADLNQIIVKLKKRKKTVDPLSIV